jgi:hypothetical protein
MKTSILIIAIFTVSFARIPELHDTTIAFFPNANIGDSIRFHEISYSDTIEQLECYPIGKTAFARYAWYIKDTFPEFDSSSIIISTNLKTILQSKSGTTEAEIMNTTLNSSHVSLLNTDIETCILVFDCTISWIKNKAVFYYQGLNYGMVISFKMKESRYAENEKYTTTVDETPPLVIREIFDNLTRPTTHVKTIPHITASAKKPIRGIFTLNGRALSKSAIRGHGLYYINGKINAAVVPLE